MPSFAGDVKNELARLNYKKDCDRRAELSGLLRMGAVMTLGMRHTVGLTFTTENAAVARKVLVLLKEAGKVNTEITVRRFRRLKQHNSYTVRVLPESGGEAFLSEIGLLPGTMPTASNGGTLLRRPCCRIAYLRGAFQAGGSVNRPEASYQLEFVTANYQFADLLLSLMRRMDMPAGITDRKDAYIVYLKESDAIVDLLAYMEAEEAVEAFEISRNVKEVRNQVNRIVNCETANLNKTADAAARQTAAIQRLEEKGVLKDLPLQLRKTAEARLEHPDAALAELAELLGVGKSGVNHRMRKLIQLAEMGEEEH